MSAFLRAWSGHASLALCSVALSLSVAACSSDDADPDVKGDKGASSAEDDESDTPKKDGGKPTTGKKDAGSSDSEDDTGGDDDTEAPVSGKDGGSDDKTPTTGTGDKSLWCGALAVIQDKCQSCHSSPIKAGAPMPLVTYADLTANAPVTKGKKVYEVVGTRVHDVKNPMPSGKPLSAEQLAPLDAWIADGAKPGDDPECKGQTKPEVVEQAWPPAGCDESYKLTAGNGKPATVGKGQETHPKFIFDAPWGDANVQAVGFRPITDNAAVIHHWILYDNVSNGAFISGWAPGQDESERKPLPDDVGVYLPKGKQSLKLDVHYNNLAGTADVKDASGVEICITRTPRKNAATTYMGFMAIPFIQPGQEVDMVGTCNVKVTQPVFMMSQSPHAHRLATHMKLEHKSGGKSQMLHDGPFAFDGQTATPLKEQVELKTGDQVITTCHFKNDTNRLVTFGENTGNEMCFNFVTYYPMGALSCAGQQAISVGDAFGGGTP